MKKSYEVVYWHRDGETPPQVKIIEAKDEKQAKFYFFSNPENRKYKIVEMNEVK